MIATPARAPSATSGDEAVRLALRSLADLYLSHDPDGVSQSEMARAIGVSCQQMARVLDGSRRLHPGQIVLLPRRAFAAALQALESCRGTVAVGTVEAGLLKLVSTAADAISDAGKVLADGRVDAAERPRVRADLVAVVSHAQSLLRSLDVVEQQERLTKS